MQETCDLEGSLKIVGEGSGKTDEARDCMADELVLVRVPATVGGGCTGLRGWSIPRRCVVGY